MTHLVELRAGRLSLALAPTIGGCVAHFRHDAFDLMRRMRTPLGMEDHALHSGMFPMVPFANSVRDNQFTVDARTYHLRPNMQGSGLNYHGSGWQRAWQVNEVTESQCVLELNEVEETAGYAFSSTQRFRLDSDKLEVSIAVSNRSPARMPFGVGLHPWFPRHLGAEVTFNARSELTTDAQFQARDFVPTPPASDYSGGREPPLRFVNQCFGDWDQKASILWPKQALLLTMKVTPIFSYLMLHVPRHDAGVFCIEPQSNRTSAFDGLDADRPAGGAHMLSPGQTIAGSVCFSVHDLGN